MPDFRRNQNYEYLWNEIIELGGKGIRAFPIIIDIRFANVSNRNLVNSQKQRLLRDAYIYFMSVGYCLFTYKAYQSLLLDVA